MIMKIMYRVYIVWRFNERTNLVTKRKIYVIIVNLGFVKIDIDLMR